MISKRKILFYIYGLSIGGVEKLLVDVLRKIDHTLFAVDLCARTGRGVYFDDIPEQVHLIDYEKCILKDYDVEVAFLEGSDTRNIALRKSAAVKIVWVHSDLYTSRLSAIGYRGDCEEAMCYSMMDKIVFVSQTSMQQFDKLFPGIDVNKQVIYNLIEKEDILSKSQATACPIKKTKLTLCSIGRLAPVKGFERLIPILSSLNLIFITGSLVMALTGNSLKISLNITT